MVDRVIIYPGSLPKSADILNIQNNMLYGLGAIVGAAIGYNTFVDGLGCTSGSGISVNIGSGSIGTLSTMDQNGIALGGLPLDSNTLMKIGINKTSTNFALVAPTTPGYAINYLIEAKLSEADGTAAVLPYYNAANPAVPFTGPANAGTSQNTIRSQIVAMQLKVGASATIGTQPTPGADAGWVPLWIVTVPYGATSVVAGNILIAPGAPFLGTKLQQQRTKLTANLTLYVATGGNDSTNNGLSTNVAFASIQAAWNALIANYDLNGYSATIQVGNGTFASVNCAGIPLGASSNTILTINGTGAGTIISGGQVGIAANNGAQVTISNMLFMGSVYSIASFTGNQITVGPGITFNTATGAHMAATGGQIIISNSYSVTGNAGLHLNCILGGVIAYSSLSQITVTLSAGLTFANFASVSSGQISFVSGVASPPGVTFSGSFTGQRFSATGGGFIATGSGNANYIPDSTAGSTGTGTNTGFYS